MIELTSEQRRALRADAHHLHPLVTVAGKGLSDSVLKEIDRSLAAHELIKVKLQGIERDDSAALLEQICTELHCAPVQRIGNVLILWREKPAEEKTAAAPRRKPKAKPQTKKAAAAALERPRRRTTARSS
ncbi:MAG: ribosome assembly RNA-binding protein YhbY [Rhodocyclaceae bacterium]|nr:ribosome assembly RNA-binding protein YhbY [Rhodocyclaceae bacterium]